MEFSIYPGRMVPPVPVVERDGRACERDQRRMRQGVPQVPGVTVKVVIVGPVCLIHHHDDVAAVGQQRVLGAGVLFCLAAAELLQGGRAEDTRINPTQARSSTGRWLGRRASADTSIRCPAGPANRPTAANGGGYRRTGQPLAWGSCVGGEWAPRRRLV